MKTLIIDNYDSFTYNIYQLVAQINSEKAIVITNNQLSWKEIEQGNFDNIIISPGPGNPKNREDFGVCQEILLNSQIPILGVCLGHQGLGYYYGSKVVKACEPFHGRISQVYHQKDTLFTSIPSPFNVVRYHSLMLASPVSSDLQVIATTENNLIMAIKHKSKPFWGVQFHPESIASQFGKQLLINFNRLSQEYLSSHNTEIRSSEEAYPFASSSPLVLFNQGQTQEKIPLVKAKTFETTSVRSPLESFSAIKNRNFSHYLKLKQNLSSHHINKQKKKLKIYSQKINYFTDSALTFKTLYAQSQHSFWLDSSMIGKGLSRFSYMGDSQWENSFLVTYQVETQKIVTTKNNQQEYHTGDIFDFLQTQLDRYIYESDELPFNFNGGFVGYFGYELKSLSGSANKHKSQSFDAQFIFVEKMIVFDHQQKNIYLLYIGEEDQQLLANNWFVETKSKLKKIYLSDKNESNNITKSINKEYILSRDENTYLANINTCLEKIKEGETYEICLTNHLHLKSIKDPLNFYCQLRKVSPAPYSAFLKLDGVAIACSSPERFLKLDKNGYIESKPIKGTVKRGINKEEDEQLKNNLKCSQKEQAENLIIVDLLRNDLGKVCEIGTINVPKLMAIESYSTVHQMVSTVRGKVKSGLKTLDCIKACFPGGSMTGAPKKRTMEIIDQLETEARGIYSGTIGFLALNGAMDLNIVIRTAIITDEKTTIGVGGAITILSDPEGEFAETILKAKALLEVQ